MLSLGCRRQMVAPMEQNKSKTIQQAVTLGLCALILSCAPVSAAPQASAGVRTEQALTKDISLIEDRFFSRQYANDPLEKRVERVELLVFGGTQSGTVDQRWSRLKQSIASRASAASPKSTANGGGTAAKAPDTSAQYPILSTLEWRALKKTFANESLDARLGRIESKLFGLPSPGIAYVDRVDRLKRTLGIGVTAAVPTGPMGPAPKSRARGQSIQDFANNFGSPPMQFPGAQELNQDNNFFNEFAQNDLPFGSNMNSTFGQMFADLHKQMAAMNQLGPGTWVYDQKTGTWIDQLSGRQVKPGLPQASPQFGPNFGPKFQPRPSSPIRQLPSRKLPMNMHKDDAMEMPPYADPNSI